jgi:hypothetical protein
LKLVFFVFFFIFDPVIRQQLTSSLLVLGRCGARDERRNDQTPKASYFFERAT